MADQTVIYTPKDYIHIQAFKEVAMGFHSAFLELNLPKSGKSLLFGAHLAPNVPENFIVYQTEQVCRDSAWMTPEYLNILNTHEVWDYSIKNVIALAANGIQAKHIPVGYMPSMSCIAACQEKDIDILHYGSLNLRRKKILEELQALGLKVVHAFNCYGSERDSLIARSKIVINIHFYESCIFEIFRVSHLLANKVCVVSESGNDIDLEGPYNNGIIMCGYGDLVKKCQNLLAEPESTREEIALEGFKVFSRNRQTDILKDCLALPQYLPG